MRRVIALTLMAGALLVPAEARALTADVEVDVTSAIGTDHLQGCRTVDIARVGRSLLGFVVYRFHQVKKWCWNFPRITSRTVWTYVDKVDPNMVYEGVVSSVGYYYNWCCGSGTSAHYSFREGKFENCVLWAGCLGTYYPWVKIWTYANGAYTYATGK